jgi:small subunit ribosomal protein S17
MPKKEKIGTVVSDKMDKTIVVAVAERHAHSKYGKIQNTTVRFKAHDPLNTGVEGMRVRIVECRPYSRDKTWRLVAVLDQAEEV